MAASISLPRRAFIDVINLRRKRRHGDPLGDPSLHQTSGPTARLARRLIGDRVHEPSLEIQPRVRGDDLVHDVRGDLAVAMAGDVEPGRVPEQVGLAPASRAIVTAVWRRIASASASCRSGDQPALAARSAATAAPSSSKQRPVSLVAQLSHYGWSKGHLYIPMA
jgi:hypothetical protein